MNYSGDLKGTPAFLGSGDPDPHVPWSRVQESADVLEGMNARVTLRRYPGRAHTVSADEVRYATAILAEAFGRPAPSSCYRYSMQSALVVQASQKNVLPDHLQHMRPLYSALGRATSKSALCGLPIPSIRRFQLAKIPVPSFAGNGYKFRHSKNAALFRSLLIWSRSADASPIRSRKPVPLDCLRRSGSFIRRLDLAPGA